MKRYILLLISVLYATLAFAQERLYIHKSDQVSLGAQLANTDSIYFSNNGATMCFCIQNTVNQYSISEIDSISFGNSDTVKITYNGNKVRINNPLAFEGVNIEANGADITVNCTNTSKEVNYYLDGSTTDGMFKIYSEYKFQLELNGVDITNTDGPAINIQSQAKCKLSLANGSTNSLNDGNDYASSDEDQKSTIFSEGEIEFDGTGSLTVGSNSKHAICSDEGISIQNGSITITKAAKDGIHSKDMYQQNGGTINISSDGDGIDCEDGIIQISGGNLTTTNEEDDTKGISCDSLLYISGGLINVTVKGNQSKGIKSKRNMTLSGGSITINTSGDAVLESSGSGYDPSYCTGIKCSEQIIANGANITINCTGLAGKGISSDDDIEISGGAINISTTGKGSSYKNTSGQTDAYVATCISADGDIKIIDGSVTTNSSGSGGKGISSDGTLTIGDNSFSPTVNVTTTGSEITLSSGSFMNADAAEAKAIKSDGAITINNGNITISSADDGIKSESSINISNATVSITKSYEGIEGTDITVNSGNVSIVSSDDGFNATHGNGGESNDGSNLNLYGGEIMVNASGGDGLDSNGNITMKDGTVVVHGPASQPEVGMDYNGTCNVSGGLLIISGPSSNMLQAPSTSSSQYSLKITSRSSLSANTLFNIQDASGNSLVTFKPERNYSTIVFSSPDLKSGSSYSIYTGGTSTGTNTNGIYNGGNYSGGTQKNSFSVSGKVTSVSF